MGEFCCCCCCCEWGGGKREEEEEEEDGSTGPRLRRDVVNFVSSLVVLVFILAIYKKKREN